MLRSKICLTLRSRFRVKCFKKIFSAKSKQKKKKKIEKSHACQYWSSRIFVKNGRNFWTDWKIQRKQNRSFRFYLFNCIFKIYRTPSAALISFLSFKEKCAALWKLTVMKYRETRERERERERREKTAKRAGEKKWTRNISFANMKVRCNQMLNSVSRPRVMKRNCIKLRCLSLTRSTTRSLWRTFFSREPLLVLSRNVFYYSLCCRSVRAFFFSSSAVVSERVRAGGRIKIHAALWSSSRDSRGWKKFAEHSAHVSSRVLPLSPRDLRESSGINRFYSNRIRVDELKDRRRVNAAFF